MTKLILTLLALTCLFCAVPPRPAKRPLIGAIRWDAWRPNNGSYGVNPLFYIEYADRQPFYGWFNVNVPNHQAIIDDEINVAADHSLDYWAFVWYPEYPQYDHADLMKPFRDYQASAYRQRMGFAFIIQTFWVARGMPDDLNEMQSRWRSETVPALVRLFHDPQYVKVFGDRPLVFWFGADQLRSQPDGFGQAWQSELEYLRDSITVSGLGTPYFVDVNANLNAARAAGFDAVSSYGPSGAKPDGAILNTPWAAQAAKDRSNWGPHAGLATVPGLTPVHDPRPRGYGYAVEQPTNEEWERHLSGALGWLRANPASPPVLLIYAWNELDEGGPGIVPTLREGKRYLEGIKRVTGRRLQIARAPALPDVPPLPLPMWCIFPARNPTRHQTP